MAQFLITICCCGGGGCGSSKDPYNSHQIQWPTVQYSQKENNNDLRNQSPGWKQGVGDKTVVVELEVS